MRFVDTNVVLYSVSQARDERGKRDLARDLLRSRDLCLSTQVLGEFFHQATRPNRTGALTHERAARRIGALRRFPVQPVTEAVVEAAVNCVARYRISYWDAAIVEAARVLGADVVLSEDLQDGQAFDGVRILNPFRP